MICSIHQPQSFPWLGFFAKIYQSDKFILLDNVQFKKNEFQNRNKIKLNNESLWFTVPVKYSFGQLISEIEINHSTKWKKKHLKTLQNVYAKAPYFSRYFYEIENLYDHDYNFLASFNMDFINWCLKKLSIETEILIASDLVKTNEISDYSATDKLLALIQSTGSDQYLSGAGGKHYLEENKFTAQNIEIIYQNYKHPLYNQLGEKFIPYLSILDLLFNEGPNSLLKITEGINETYTQKNILAIGAHPDDIEIGCGGTLAKLKDEGHSVSMYVVSDGSAGGNSDIRHKEQKDAANIIQVDNLFWGGYKDTEIVISKEIISCFEDIIKQINPDYIFVNSPDDTHQDHRHLAQITISATRYIKNVLFYETPTTTNFQPDIYIDLDEKYLKIKHQLLHAHKSQIDKTNIANLSIFDVASSNAQFRGTQGRVKFAEAFKPLRLFLNV